MKARFSFLLSVSSVYYAEHFATFWGTECLTSASSSGGPQTLQWGGVELQVGVLLLFRLNL
jgi:hypothetical protein